MTSSLLFVLKKKQDVPLNDTLCRLFRSTAKSDNLIQKENGFRININLESLHIFLFVCTSYISASFTEINVYSIMFVAERRTTADNPACKIVKKNRMRAHSFRRRNCHCFVKFTTKWLMTCVLILRQYFISPVVIAKGLFWPITWGVLRLDEAKEQNRKTTVGGGNF